jgi:hypothetical protein
LKDKGEIPRQKEFSKKNHLKITTSTNSTKRRKSSPFKPPHNPLHLHRINTINKQQKKSYDHEKNKYNSHTPPTKERKKLT